MPLAAIPKTFLPSNSHKIREKHYSFHQADTSKTFTLRKTADYSSVISQKGLRIAPSGPDSLLPSSKKTFFDGRLCTISMGDGTNIGIIPNVGPYSKGGQEEGFQMASFMLVPILLDKPQYPDIAHMPANVSRNLFKLTQMLSEKIRPEGILFNWASLAAVLKRRNGSPLSDVQSINLVHGHYLPAMTSESLSATDTVLPINALSAYGEQGERAQAAMLINDPFSTSLKRAVVESTGWETLRLETTDETSDSGILRIDFGKPINEMDPKLLDEVFRIYFGTIGNLSKGLTQTVLQNGGELTKIYERILKTPNPKELLGQIQTEFSHVHDNLELVRSRKNALKEANRYGIPIHIINSAYETLGNFGQNTNDIPVVGLGACAGLTIDADRNVSFQGKAFAGTSEGGGMEKLRGTILMREASKPDDNTSFLVAQQNTLQAVQAAVTGQATVTVNPVWQRILDDV